MDKTDMSLIMLLSANSRLSYAELAEKLNLSVNAIHKRIQSLIETGVIRTFTAKVSLLSANAIVVFISGTSQLGSFQDLPAKLKARLNLLACRGRRKIHPHRCLPEKLKRTRRTRRILEERSRTF